MRKIIELVSSIKFVVIQVAVKTMWAICECVRVINTDWPEIWERLSRQARPCDKMLTILIKKQVEDKIRLDPGISTYWIWIFVHIWLIQKPQNFLLAQFWIIMNTCWSFFWLSFLPSLWSNFYISFSFCAFACVRK